MSATAPETISIQKSSTRIGLKLLGLTKQFGDTTVVDNLTLEIPQGNFLGLIGANGAGKSTTLKMRAGMLDQSSGTAEILGTKIEDLEPSHLSRIGYVPESHQIYRWMTIAETVWFCKKLNSRWNDKTCSELLKLFRLDTSKKVRSLSKGMLTKLGLALAISHDPEILLLDEPMSGLDPIARDEFLDGVLRTVSDMNCTVILSSHSIDDVQRMSDSIGLIHQGRLLMHRPTEEVLQETKRIRFVLDEDGCPPVLESTVFTKNENREWFITVSGFSQLMLEKLNHNQHVRHIEVQDLSLEEVYKDYVWGQEA